MRSFQIHLPLLLILLLGVTAHAQQAKQKRDLYYESTFRPKGWFFSPGLTWMWPSDARRTDTRISRAEMVNDTLYDGTFRSAGKPGLYAEVGRHRFIDGLYFLHHLDYGIHFKMLRGKEEFEGRVKTPSGLVATNNRGNFSESFAGLFINASNIIQFSNVTWLHQSVGLNAEYRVISHRSYDGLATGMPHQYPDDILGQLHYKIGLGWKADPGLYFMALVETPVLTAYPFDDGKSTLTYFSSRYRPLIITLRVMFLDKSKGRSCENQPGSSDQVDKEKPGRHGSGDLFGPDVKMKGRRRR
jgi:hypothetical protein